MLNLLWKEWHEQSWKLAFSCVVLSAMALIGLHARIIDDQSMVVLVCFLGVMLLPIVSNADLVSAERTDGSLVSLMALPETPALILAAKTLVGLLLCAGPLVMAGAVSLFLAGGREMTDVHMFDLYARAALIAMFLFVWMLALTIRLPSETRVSLLSIGLLILWILVTLCLKVYLIPEALFSVQNVLFSVSPLALADQNQIADLADTLLHVFVQAVVLVPLWIWASKRFANSQDRP